MPKDYVPSNDQQFDAWLMNFVSTLSTYAVQVGLLPADIDPLDVAESEFGGAIVTHLTKRTEAESATAAKNTKRATAEGLLRPLVRRVSNHPGMTDQLRAALGLNVPASGHTTSTVGVEFPDLYLESMPGKVVVHFGTNPTNERINGKPSWAKGCNIYSKKTGEAEYHLLAFTSSSPFIDNVTGPASDYTYVVRYQGTKAGDIGGESSPMSIAASGQLAA